MKTYKPISTISYNTEEFLNAKLKSLKSQGVISFFAYMKHFPEPKDEFGQPETKIHYHCYIVPSKIIDTIPFENGEFYEVDLSGCGLPLNILPCKFSQFADWFLYALHDEGYLAYKGETRYYHYLYEEFVTSDNDVMLQYVHESDMSKYRKVIEFRRHVESGEPFSELVYNGFVPYEKIYQYEKVYHTLRSRRDAWLEVQRGIRPCNHEGGFVMNEETGEWVYDETINLNTVKNVYDKRGNYKYSVKNNVNEK